MGKNLCDNSHGTGVRPLGNKAGNVQSTFTVGKDLDVGRGTGWAGDKDTNAGNTRRASGGNKANSSGGTKRGSSLSELANVDGRSSKKDGQRYGGSPAKSASSRGPSGINSKKGRLK